MFLFKTKRDLPFLFWVLYVKELLTVQSWKQVHESICLSKSFSFLENEGNLIILNCIKPQGWKVNEVMDSLIPPWNLLLQESPCVDSLDSSIWKRKKEKKEKEKKEKKKKE